MHISNANVYSRCRVSTTATSLSVFRSAAMVESMPVHGIWVQQGTLARTHHITLKPYLIPYLAVNTTAVNQFIHGAVPSPMLVVLFDIVLSPSAGTNLAVLSLPFFLG